PRTYGHDLPVSLILGHTGPGAPYTLANDAVGCEDRRLGGWASEPRWRLGIIPAELASPTSPGAEERACEFNSHVFAARAMDEIGRSVGVLGLWTSPPSRSMSPTDSSWSTGSSGFTSISPVWRENCRPLRRR